MSKFLFFIFLPFYFQAQHKYSVDSIPLPLKDNVDAVIRSSRTDFIIKDDGFAILKTHFVVTVFNSVGAENYNRHTTWYDKFTKVKKMEGIIYDENGNQIYKAKKKDIFDISYSAQSNEVTDDREKLLVFDKTNFTFPYTVEFITEVKTKNMMFYPSMYFYTYDRVSTQEKSLVIETPENFSFRFKEKNMPIPVTCTTERKTKKYVWMIKNISAAKYEPYTPQDYYPAVHTAPKSFHIQDYYGEIQSWNDLGRFLYKLNEGRDSLPSQVKQKVQELVRNEKDTLRKIELLYHYLQSNTRYVSIQLGIGGWQTMNAEEVAAKGYGDCKALSNYMKALLGAAGIRSFTAFIMAGKYTDVTDPDFPSMNFNHAINCVPLVKDTIWLECTSQTNAMGYEGSFTGNRKALLILPQGGELVNTSRYTSDDNIQNRMATITVDEYGDAKAQVKTIYKGFKQEAEAYILHANDREQQKKRIQNEIPLPSFVLKSFSFNETRARIPVIEENLSLSISKLLTKTGATFFLKPYLMDKKEITLPEKSERNSPFLLNPNVFDIQENDSLFFNIPAIFSPEFIPATLSLKSRFGEYSRTLKFENNILFYQRKLILKAGYFPSTDYKEWFDFIKKMISHDKIQIAFKVNK